MKIQPRYMVVIYDAMGRYEICGCDSDMEIDDFKLHSVCGIKITTHLKSSQHKFVRYCFSSTIYKPIRWWTHTSSI